VESVVLIFLAFCVVVFGGGSVVLIFLAFCVVVFGGVCGAHLFSFLYCGTTQKTKMMSTTDPHQKQQHRKLKR
jgi:cell division protein FtsW (lipid II flippase)